MHPIPQFALVSPSPVTLHSLVTLLGNRLDAPYWTAAELELVVIEALRFWNAATKYWRKRVTFQTAPGVLFYDLPSLLPDLAYFVTDQSVVTEMEYHLLEPATTNWTGSDMFTLAGLTAALQNRRDQFLVETGMVVSQFTRYVDATPVGRFVLPKAVMRVDRCVWQDADGEYSQLSRVNETELLSYRPRWNRSAQKPKAYTISSTPPFTLQLAPPPSTHGYLQMLVVAVGAPLDPGMGEPLGVPDDFAWAVKWGALADLLSADGPARDPARAQYAEQRYRQGVEMALLTTFLLQAEVNTHTAGIGPVAEQDVFDPGWHNREGQPNRILTMGTNLAGVNRMPDAMYGITLDVVTIFPDINLTADLLLPQSSIDAILDYAQHIASFKMGGAEFEATMPQFERTLRMAGITEAGIGAGDRSKDVTDATAREGKYQWRQKSVSTR